MAPLKSDVHRPAAMELSLILNHVGIIVAAKKAATTAPSSFGERSSVELAATRELLEKESRSRPFVRVHAFVHKQ